MSATPALPSAAIGPRLSIIGEALIEAERTARTRIAQSASEAALHQNKKNREHELRDKTTQKTDRDQPGMNAGLTLDSDAEKQARVARRLAWCVLLVGQLEKHAREEAIMDKNERQEHRVKKKERVRRGVADRQIMQRGTVGNEWEREKDERPRSKLRAASVATLEPAAPDPGITLLANDETNKASVALEDIGERLAAASQGSTSSYSIGSCDTLLMSKRKEHTKYFREEWATESGANVVNAWEQNMTTAEQNRLHDQRVEGGGQLPEEEQRHVHHSLLAHLERAKREVFEQVDVERARMEEERHRMVAQLEAQRHKTEEAASRIQAAMESEIERKLAELAEATLFAARLHEAERGAVDAKRRQEEKEAQAAEKQKMHEEIGMQTLLFKQQLDQERTRLASAEARCQIAEVGIAKNQDIAAIHKFMYFTHTYMHTHSALPFPPPSLHYNTHRKRQTQSRKHTRLKRRRWLQLLCKIRLRHDTFICVT